MRRSRVVAVVALCAGLTVATSAWVPAVADNTRSTFEPSHNAAGSNDPNDCGSYPTNPPTELAPPGTEQSSSADTDGHLSAYAHTAVAPSPLDVGYRCANSFAEGFVKTVLPVVGHSRKIAVTVTYQDADATSTSTKQGSAESFFSASAWCVGGCSGYGGPGFLTQSAPAGPPSYQGSGSFRFDVASEQPIDQVEVVVGASASSWSYANGYIHGYSTTEPTTENQEATSRISVTITSITVSAS